MKEFNHNWEGKILNVCLCAGEWEGAYFKKLKKNYSKTPHMCPDTSMLHIPASTVLTGNFQDFFLLIPMLGRRTTLLQWNRLQYVGFRWRVASQVADN